MPQKQKISSNIVTTLTKTFKKMVHIKRLDFQNLGFISTDINENLLWVKLSFRDWESCSENTKKSFPALILVGGRHLGDGVTGGVKWTVGVEGVVSKVFAGEVTGAEAWRWTRRKPWRGLEEEFSRQLEQPAQRPWAKAMTEDSQETVGLRWRGQWVEKRVAEDEMVRWHHQLNRHEFEQTSGDSGGQRNLACRIPWGLKESDTT